jgi:hypothetical protein
MVFPEQSGRIQWSGRRASRRIESRPIGLRHATMQQRLFNPVEDGPTRPRLGLVAFVPKRRGGGATLPTA